MKNAGNGVTRWLWVVVFCLALPVPSWGTSQPSLIPELTPKQAENLYPVIWTGTHLDLREFLSLEEKRDFVLRASAALGFKKIFQQTESSRKALEILDAFERLDRSALNRTIGLFAGRAFRKFEERSCVRGSLAQTISKGEASSIREAFERILNEDVPPLSHCSLESLRDLRHSLEFYKQTTSKELKEVLWPKQSFWREGFKAFRPWKPTLENVEEVLALEDMPRFWLAVGQTLRKHKDYEGARDVYESLLAEELHAHARNIPPETRDQIRREMEREHLEDKLFDALDQNSEKVEERLRAQFGFEEGVNEGEIERIVREMRDQAVQEGVSKIFQQRLFNLAYQEMYEDLLRSSEEVHGDHKLKAFHEMIDMVDPRGDRFNLSDVTRDRLNPKEYLDDALVLVAAGVASYFVGKGVSIGLRTLLLRALSRGSQRHLLIQLAPWLVSGLANAGGFIAMNSTLEAFLRLASPLQGRSLWQGYWRGVLEWSLITGTMRGGTLALRRLAQGAKIPPHLLPEGSPLGKVFQSGWKAGAIHLAQRAPAYIFEISTLGLTSTSIRRWMRALNGQPQDGRFWDEWSRVCVRILGLRLASSLVNTALFGVTYSESLGKTSPSSETTSNIIPFPKPQVQLRTPKQVFLATGTDDPTSHLEAYATLGDGGSNGFDGEPPERGFFSQGASTSEGMSSGIGRTDPWNESRIKFTPSVTAQTQEVLLGRGAIVPLGQPMLTRGIETCSALFVRGRQYKGLVHMTPTMSLPYRSTVGIHKLSGARDTVGRLVGGLREHTEEDFSQMDVVILGNVGHARSIIHGKVDFGYRATREDWMRVAQHLVDQGFSRERIKIVEMPFVLSDVHHDPKKPDEIQIEGRPAFFLNDGSRVRDRAVRSRSYSVSISPEEKEDFSLQIPEYPRERLMSLEETVDSRFVDEPLPSESPDFWSRVRRDVRQVGFWRAAKNVFGGDVEGLQRDDLVAESRMRSLLGSDFRQPHNEAQHYRLMRNYAESLPTMTSVEDLFEAGLFRVTPEGRIESDYVMSHTHLGVLTLKRQEDGTYRVLQNRGTSYFADGSTEKVMTALGYGGYSARPFIQSRAAERIYKGGELDCVVAVPKTELEELDIPIGWETDISPRKITQARGVRVFQVDHSTMKSLAEFERDTGFSLRKISELEGESDVDSLDEIGMLERRFPGSVRVKDGTGVVVPVDQPIHTLNLQNCAGFFAMGPNYKLLAHLTPTFQLAYRTVEDPGNTHSERVETAKKLSQALRENTDEALSEYEVVIVTNIGQGRSYFQGAMDLGFEAVERDVQLLIDELVANGFVRSKIYHVEVPLRGTSISHDLERSRSLILKGDPIQFDPRTRLLEAGRQDQPRKFTVSVGSEAGLLFEKPRYLKGQEEIKLAIHGISERDFSIGRQTYDAIRANVASIESLLEVLDEAEGGKGPSVGSLFEFDFAINFARVERALEQGDWERFLWQIQTLVGEIPRFRKDIVEPSRDILFSGQVKGSTSRSVQSFLRQFEKILDALEMFDQETSIEIPSRGAHKELLRTFSIMEQEGIGSRLEYVVPHVDLSKAMLTDPNALITEDLREYVWILRNAFRRVEETYGQSNSEVTFEFVPSEKSQNPNQWALIAHFEVGGQVHGLADMLLPELPWDLRPQRLRHGVQGQSGAFRPEIKFTDENGMPTYEGAREIFLGLEKSEDPPEETLYHRIDEGDVQGYYTVFDQVVRPSENKTVLEIRIYLDW